jgi:hypothetical protein
MADPPCSAQPPWQHVGPSLLPSPCPNVDAATAEPIEPGPADPDHGIVNAVDTTTPEPTAESTDPDLGVDDAVDAAKAEPPKAEPTTSTPP